MGPGLCPGRKRVMVHLELEKTHLIAINLVFLQQFPGGPIKFQEISRISRSCRHPGFSYVTDLICCFVLFILHMLLCWDWAHIHSMQPFLTAAFIVFTELSIVWNASYLWSRMVFTRTRLQAACSTRLVCILHAHVRSQLHQMLRITTFCAKTRHCILVDVCQSRSLWMCSSSFNTAWHWLIVCWSFLLFIGASCL